MRKIQNTTGKRVCTYPNTVHFSNVPALVRVAWDNPDGLLFVPENVTITLTDTTGRVYAETRAVFNNEVVFDIRRYLQTAFSNAALDRVDYSGEMWAANNNLRTIEAVVAYIGENGETVVVVNFSTDAVFGNIERGESTGGNIRRRWFVNYPFTLDWWVRGKDEFSVIVDGVDRPGISFPNEKGSGVTTASGFTRATLNVGTLVDSFNADKRIRLVQPFGYVAKNDRESVGVVAYDLDIDRTPKDAGKRVYLRWIDNLGRFCYFLFRDLGTSDAVTGSSYASAVLTNPVIYDDGANVGTTIRQDFARVKTRNLGAKGVDRELFDFLLTLNTSPWVDMFDGYDEDNTPQWHRVNVSPATVAKSTKTIQDYTVAIVEPTQNTQSL